VSNEFAANGNRRFDLQKRFNFSSARNETLAVAAMCVGNPDRSPLRING
jgi:hypothetical protein